MLSRAHELVKEIRMRLLIRRMRKDLEFFGYDVSGFTDQQLLDQLGLASHRFAEAALAAGVSLETMAGMITNVAAALRRTEEPNDG
jgi:hypothetical protein